MWSIYRGEGSLFFLVCFLFIVLCFWVTTTLKEALHFTPQMVCNVWPVIFVKPQAVNSSFCSNLGFHFFGLQKFLRLPFLYFHKLVDTV